MAILDPEGNAHGEPVMELLERAGCRVVVSGAGDDDEVIDAVRDADGILVTHGISLRVMQSLTRCKVIARNGIGMDSIEGMELATEKGIVLCNMPGIIEEEVADQTMAMLLAAARCVIPLDRYVRDGSWASGAPLPVSYIPRLSGASLGLIGLGRIGQAVARRAAGFGMRLSAHDPMASREAFFAHGVAPVTLGAIFQDCDFVSLHVPLTRETRHLVGAAQLRLMRPHAILINTSRGPVVDQEALVASLAANEIGGAALDVAELEPLPAGHRLVGLDN
ncbi:MAG: D-isomer specific 2-hydroxyacid dehydrogenase NAD-binding protein, partial [Acidimicrobiaceae bacterium]|nr:D-isomer specific 2-hydroxyacid dehydrogenase NAD-binding protein [Acidimicrobiaceae bacterium]